MKGTPEMEENSYPLIRMEEPQGHVLKTQELKELDKQIVHLKEVEKQE